MEYWIVTVMLLGFVFALPIVVELVICKLMGQDPVWSRKQG